jgi:hypothetical protein
MITLAKAEQGKEKRQTVFHKEEFISDFLIGGEAAMTCRTGKAYTEGERQIKFLQNLWKAESLRRW